jgi:hypothetical protein
MRALHGFCLGGALRADFQKGMALEISSGFPPFFKLKKALGLFFSHVVLLEFSPCYID